ncbi:MAG: hypothetical protein DRP10_01135 [Candidatus Aenigmatarchaeota archaeon]|nr:MAG: hypothetical protein DRP10_01135 [Candidatus Aenigmarchaeota archaeon]
MKRLFFGILLVSLVFVSGCTMPDSIPVGGKYCKAIGLCTVEEKTVEIPDVIVIKNIDIPVVRDGRIGPNREIDIFVTLENRDQDKPITLTYVGINPGIFKCVECEKTNEKINPGQEKTFSFKLTSPDNSGTMALPGHLEVSVKYEYTSTRLATITYINKNTYIEYLQSGGKIPVDIINVPSDGPVELYLDISKIKQPVIIEDESTKTSLEEGKYQIYLEVMNKGSGEIDKIAPEDLTINFRDMNVKSCSEEFKIINKNKVKNIKPIIMRGQKPFKYYFSFDPSNSIKNELTEDRLTVTKKIIASAEYIYRIYKPLDILVSPRAEY